MNTEYIQCVFAGSPLKESKKIKKSINHNELYCGKCGGIRKSMANQLKCSACKETMSLYKAN